MASFSRIAPVALAGLLVAGGASAQPGGPRMPPGHPMAQGASFGPDCAVSAIEVVAQPRRTMAVVDVGLRFRSNKGGNCMARAEAVQITTGKAGAVSRAFSELVQDDQLQKPIAVADAPGGERLRPWMTQMKPGEEKTIVYRFYVDGDVLVGSEVDPASRVRVDLRALGTRVLEHTPITVSLVLPQAARGKLSLQTGNPKGTTQNVGTTAGKAEIKQSLTKDDLLPVIDFKVESELPPAVTPATLAPGLGTLEYMRDGFARELATALDGNKDEKKVAEAWDRAYDLAFMAMRSTDPIVAGHGVRSMAWLASGLSPAATHVRAEGESGDGVIVPASIAKEAAAAMTVYGNLTGQRTAPSPVGARSVRLVLPRLGEPGSRKKEAEEGLKRLAKRVEKKEVTETKFADTFAALAFPKVGAGAPATSRAIVFGPKGPQFVGEGKGGHAVPKRAFAGRMTRYLTHGRGVLKVFFGITALGGLGVLIYLAMSRVKGGGSAQEGASAVLASWRLGVLASTSALSSLRAPWQRGHDAAMNQPPGGGYPPGGYGPPPGYGPPTSPTPGQGAPATTPGYPPQGGYAQPPGGAPPAPGGYGQPPPGYGQPAPGGYGQQPPAGGYAPPPGYGPQPGAWPSPAAPAAGSWAGPSTGFADPNAATLASKDPQQVFLIELLCTGLLGLPGIGHLIIGDVGLGVALLIGYPIVFWGGYLLLTLVTCGFGAILIVFMWPINFLVGFLLGNRAKQRVIDAKRALGQPV